jgi:hypothetical protein
MLLIMWTVFTHLTGVPGNERADLTFVRLGKCED